MLRFTDTMNLLARLALVLMLMLSTASCSTTRSVNNSESRKTQETSSLVESTIRDRYDSIYVLHDRSLNTIHDTVWTTERITEYRFRYLHDTVLVARTDTLIQMQEVERIQEVQILKPRSPTWLDRLAYSSLAILVLLLLYRIRSTANLLK